MCENKEKIETLATVKKDGGLAQLETQQRWARLFLAADILPAEWLKGREDKAIARLVICLNLAEKKHIDPLLLIQNIDFIAGRICWKSTFLLQLLKLAGWTKCHFIFDGDPQNSADFLADDNNGCTFCAVDPATGEEQKGTKITVGMVKKEGWLGRTGSKWASMPEQMFKYRSAAFFCRTNAPETLGGIYSRDEIDDFVNQGQDND